MTFDQKISTKAGAAATGIDKGGEVQHHIVVRNIGKTRAHYVIRSSLDAGLSYPESPQAAWVVRGRHLEVDPDFLDELISPSVDNLGALIRHSDDSHIQPHAIAVEFTHAPSDQLSFPPAEWHRRTLTCN